ncbi:MAG: glycine dehydrogenase (aminomethyl-transferring), partial [Xanthomonadales bacterium]|nr:glycine dehydrogenase (aminomethyl-transferring) [Xanthomonadales bacterium]
MPTEPTPRVADSPLSKLENHSEFIRRHIGPDDGQIKQMLGTLGAGSLEELVASTLPAAIQTDEPLQLADAVSETRALTGLREIASLNVLKHSMIGLGYHDTITPAVILRNILENPGWYTAYTPYQAEISQGRLEAMLNFQQMICDLTGMELANASLLDEATAAAEAMAMLKRINRKNKSTQFFVDQGVLPQTLDVLQTRARHFGYEIVVGDAASGFGKGDYFGALLQYPSTRGEVNDIAPQIATAHAQGTLVVVATDLMSLVMLKPPGELDADIVTGSAQRFGVPLGFGGPHAAFFATRDSFKRSLPGRIIGVSKDRLDQPALRMALQTREQHIRRDHATSNICTAQALLAVMASMYAVYHGAEGLKRIAGRIHRLASLLAVGLKLHGFRSVNKTWFDTLSYDLDGEQADTIYQRALDTGINIHRSATGLTVSVNEKTTREHVEVLLDAFTGETTDSEVNRLERDLDTDFTSIPLRLQRENDFLQHPVFKQYHSET